MCVCMFVSMYACRREQCLIICVCGVFCFQFCCFHSVLLVGVCIFEISTSKSTSKSMMHSDSPLVLQHFMLLELHTVHSIQQYPHLQYFGYWIDLQQILVSLLFWFVLFSVFNQFVQLIHWIPKILKNSPCLSVLWTEQTVKQWEGADKDIWIGARLTRENHLLTPKRFLVCSSKFWRRTIMFSVMETSLLERYVCLVWSAFNVNNVF